MSVFSLPDSRKNAGLSPQTTPRRSVIPSFPTRESPMGSREAETAIVSATLANVQLRAAQAAIQQRSAEVDDLREMRDTLEKEVTEKDQESLAAVKFFEKQMASAADANRKLKAELLSERLAAELCVEEVVGKMRGELEERDRTIEDLKERLRAANAELLSVIEFREARDEHMREMEELRAAYTKECENRQRETRDARLQCMEERVRLKEKEEKYERHREEEVERLACRYLSKKTRAIEEQNRNLEQDISFLSCDVEAARSEVGLLRDTNCKLRRDIQIACSAEAMHTAQNAKQKHEIALLREQVRVAEDNLNSSVEEYEKRLRKQEKTHAAEVTKLLSECDKWRSAAEHLRADLVKMRSISAKMVEQRTDVEKFFVEALTQVRHEVSEERRSASHKIGYHKQPAGPPFSFLQLTRGREPLMIGDRCHAFSSTKNPRRKMVEANVSCLNRGTASESADTGGTSLPLITMSGSPFFSQANLLVPPIEWRGANREMQVSSPGKILEDRPSGINDLSSVPTVPKLKDLHSVDISQLSWSDKERVLQLLFKQMKRGVAVNKTERRVPADDANFLSSSPSVVPEMNVFLTD